MVVRIRPQGPITSDQAQGCSSARQSGGLQNRASAGSNPATLANHLDVHDDFTGAATSTAGTRIADTAPPYERTPMTFDLILRGGRVIDPSQGIDQVADVAFAGGKVARVDREVRAERGTEVRDVSGYIVTPGLIDLHTHVY